MTRATHIPRLTGGDAGISREALRAVREKYAPIRTNRALPWIVEVLQPPRVAVCISDDLQFEQIVCRTSSCSRLGGVSRTFARTSYQLGIISLWGHKNNTIISCLDHKVGGLLNSCVPDERCRDLKQPTEKNAIY